jgi:hypothetical protein
MDSSDRCPSETCSVSRVFQRASVSTATANGQNPESIRFQRSCVGRTSTPCRQTQGPRLAARDGGQQARESPATPDDNFQDSMACRARNGSNYVRQYVSLAPRETDVNLRDRPRADTGKETCRCVDGLPVSSRRLFFSAFEHPVQDPEHSDGRASPCYLPRNVPLKVGEEQT